MYLYTFNESVTECHEVDLRGVMVRTGDKMEPIENFKNCLITDEPIPPEVALAVWSSYCER